MLKVFFFGALPLALEKARKAKAEKIEEKNVERYMNAWIRKSKYGQTGASEIPDIKESDNVINQHDKLINGNRFYAVLGELIYNNDPVFHMKFNYPIEFREQIEWTMGMIASVNNENESEQKP